MREFRLEKLVRDRIAEDIVNGGGKINFRILGDEEILEEAKKKLKEEANELQTASKEKLAGELADIQELVHLVCELRGIPVAELEQIRRRKVKKAGSFEKRIFIKIVKVPDDSPWVDYYLSQPDKYPEVK